MEPQGEICVQFSQDDENQDGKPSRTQLFLRDGTTGRHRTLRPVALVVVPCITPSLREQDRIKRGLILAPWVTLTGYRGYVAT